MFAGRGGTKVAVQLFAAIDVGSFELELGIYEISGKNGVRRVDHIRHMIALGKRHTARARSATNWWRKCARFWKIL